MFTRTGSTWSQEAYVKASNTEAGDAFGLGLAISGGGNTLAVTTVVESSSATGINGNQSDNSAAVSGAAYVFTRSGSTWSQEAYIKASNTEAGDAFGFSADLSADGNTLAVGAISESSNATGINGNQSDNSAGFSGAAYVFTRSGVTWSQQAYVKASNTEPDDRFGISIALSGDGNTLAVVAVEEDSNATGVDGNQSDNSAAVSGAAYVFTRSGSTWSQQAYVKASNTEANDAYFQGVDPHSVALSGDGDTLALTGPGEDSSAIGIGGDQANNTALESGAVYLY